MLTKFLDFIKVLKIKKNRNISRSLIVRNVANLNISETCKIFEYVILNCDKEIRNSIVLGDSVILKPKVYLTGQVTLSRYCGIGHNCWIGGKGKVFVGENSLVGMNTVILTDNHDYKNITLPFYDSKPIIKDVVIGKNVWIGCNCSILPGSVIEDNVVVGAGSIINGHISKGKIVVSELGQILERKR